MSAALVILKVMVGATLIVAGSALAIWGVAKGAQGIFWVVTRIFQAIGFVFGRVFTFIRSTFADAGRSVGALLTALVLIPLTVLNFIFGRWRQGSHYAAALEDELVAFGLGIYRVALGNPLQLVGLGVVTDGFERRLPEVVARAPRAPRASVKDGKFDGYKVTGVLPAGGSGARLFLAKPRPGKLEELRAAGYEDPGQVVIKSFHLASGSTMPQIVRESRALQSARRLGLVLEHELTDSSFFYVMPYVPGENLDVVITRLHEDAAPAGLSDRQLRVSLGYVGDLLYTLDAFHGGGLWHKDIKPSNLIISSGRAHLVDLGLVTPLESAMTLTTHGTEYYRDPEMVRLALKGVKVHEVNGVKFDIYSTGALLYSMIENSFPAQGSLSKITKRCPEAVHWIVRRAMADLDTRYGSAQEMLADIRTVLAARDPFGVRPADLPSMGGKSDWTLRRASFAKSRRAPQAEASRPAQAGAPGARRDTATFVRERRRSTGRGLLTATVGALFLAGSGALAIMAIEGEGPFASPGQSWSPSTPQVSATWSHADLSPSESPTDALESVRAAWEMELGRDFLGGNSRGSDSRGSNSGGSNSGGSDSGGSDSLHQNEHTPTVLILQDLLPQTDRALLGGLREELQRRGVHVLGAPAAGEEDAADLDYVARARASLGLSSPSDPDARLSLERFLAEHPDLDAVLWLASGDDPESLEYRVVRPRSVEVSAPDTFRLSSYGGAD